jgi:hypothetical protein
MKFSMCIRIYMYCKCRVLVTEETPYSQAPFTNNEVFSHAPSPVETTALNYVSLQPHFSLSY